MTKEKKITILTNLLEQFWDDAFQAGKESVYAPQTIRLTKDRPDGIVYNMMLTEQDFVPPQASEQKRDLTPDTPNESLTQREVFISPRYSEKIAELEKKLKDYQEHYVHQDLLFKEQDRSCELKQLNEALEQQVIELKKTLTEAQAQLERMIQEAWERAEMADAFDDKEW